MHNNLFIPASFFLLRVPSWSIQEYEHFDSEESLLALYNSNELFREAICIASPSLYHALQNIHKDSKKVAKGLLKYALRMSSRATPFGLFSFVAKGYFDQSTEIVLNDEKIDKKIRLDMEWLYTYIKKLYEDKDRFSSLSVRANPLVEQRGNRIFLLFSLRKTGESYKQASIKLTTIVASIFSLTKKPITISTLCNILKESFDFFDLQKTLALITNLLSQQFLLPGMIPSLLDPLQSEKFLSLPEFIKIQDLMQIYLQTPIGQGEASLSQIQKEMEGLIPTQPYLQVDAVYTDKVSISEKVAEEIGKAATLLWKISSNQARSPALSIYHDRFLEKYGIHRTVPLLEMLHEEKGLGPMEKQQLSMPTKKAPPFSSQWEKWLCCEWQKCLRDKKDEIVITEKEVDALFLLANEQPPSDERAPPSFDIFCKVLSADSSNPNDFRLHLTQPAWQGCSSMGRFLPILGKEAEQECRNYLSQEEELDKDTIFIEASTWPSLLRSANVTIQPRLRKWRIDLEEEQKNEGSLALEDIYVGATLDRFYLTLKEGGDELSLVSGNLLNTIFLPSPLRFMRAVTLDRHQQLYPFSWGKLEEKSIFLPRVRFQNTILSLARWNVDAISYANKKIDEIIPFFKVWANEWNLPSRFFLVEGDQRLLLDRELSFHLQELAKRLAKGESLCLEEYLTESCVKSQKGDHLSEIVIPFMKNPLRAMQKKSFTPLVHVATPYHTRVCFPGSSNWLFAKIYLGSEEVNRFLIERLIPFAESLQEKKLILGFFFIRYHDPDAHIRFRIKINCLESLGQLNLETAVPGQDFVSESFAMGVDHSQRKATPTASDYGSKESVNLSPPTAISRLMHALNVATTQWHTLGLIHNFVLAGYEREIERYGGQELYEIVEELFCADSIAIEPLLRLLDKDESFLQAASVISFLRDLNFNYMDMMTFLNQFGDDTRELKEFRKHKARLISIIRAFEDESLLNDDARIFRKIAEQRSPATLKLFEQAQKTNSSSWLEICHSLLHMHCNRIGCDTKTEKRSRLYAFHALKSWSNATGRFAVAESSP